MLSNILYYTPKGGLVTVVLNPNDHHVLITIQDTRIGIAAEEQTMIFDRFYRVNSDRSRNTGSSGLGLAIAKRCGKQIAQAIVQAHHGSLQVQIEFGKGSIFKINYPGTTLIAGNQL